MLSAILVSPFEDIPFQRLSYDDDSRSQRLRSANAEQRAHLLNEFGRAFVCSRAKCGDNSKNQSLATG